MTELKRRLEEVRGSRHSDAYVHAVLNGFALLPAELILDGFDESSRAKVRSCVGEGATYADLADHIERLFDRAKNLSGEEGLRSKEEAMSLLKLVWGAFAFVYRPNDFRRGGSDKRFYSAGSDCRHRICEVLFLPPEWITDCSRDMLPSGCKQGRRELRLGIGVEKSILSKRGGELSCSVCRSLVASSVEGAGPEGLELRHQDDPNTVFFLRAFLTMPFAWLKRAGVLKVERAQARTRTTLESRLDAV